MELAEGTTYGPLAGGTTVGSSCQASNGTITESWYGELIDASLYTCSAYYGAEMIVNSVNSP